MQPSLGAPLARALPESWKLSHERWHETLEDQTPARFPSLSVGKQPKSWRKKAFSVHNPLRAGVEWKLLLRCSTTLFILFGSCSSGSAVRVLIQNNSCTSQKSAFHAPVIPKVEEPTVLLNFASCWSLPRGWWILQPPPRCCSKKGWDTELWAQGQSHSMLSLGLKPGKAFGCFYLWHSQEGIQQWTYSYDKINLASVKSALPSQKWDSILEFFSNLKDSVIIKK